MPMIKIKYDDGVVKKDEIAVLSEAVQRIVSDVTGVEDVFVYADSPEIKVKVAPIEIFVEMTASKISSKGELTKQLKDKLVDWKKVNNFSQPINLSLIPANWEVEIGI